MSSYRYVGVVVAIEGGDYLFFDHGIFRQERVCPQQ